MSSAEENCSDEDLLEEEWPDDYFEFDADAEKEIEPTLPDLKEDEIHLEESPSVQLHSEIEGSNLLALPMEMLRLIVQPLGLQDRLNARLTCQSLRTAVATSKCVNLGDGRIEVTAMEIVSELFVHVNIGGLIRLDKATGESIQEFARLRLFFEKLHLKELKLNKVTLDNELLRSFNCFIDECTFDKLLIVNTATPTLVSVREQKLISQARREAVIEMGAKCLKGDQMLAISRPVTFYVCTNTPNSFLSEELFIDLVRRGHSLVNFETSLSSVQTIGEVVKLVSRSLINQRIAVLNSNFDACKQYVEKVKAKEMKEVYGPHRAFIDTASHFHLGAVIHLATRRGNPVDAVLKVHSRNHPDDRRF